MIWQTREDFNFQSFDKPGDENVFWRREYIYGVSGRSNAGFGLWQLAFASKAPLNKENYEAARATMMSRLSDSGSPLGVVPTVMVVPPSLEGAGLRVLKMTVNGGEVNEWAGSAELIVSPYL